jgi:hypothetical protein
MPDKFEQHCIVELFGHNIIAGLVSEQTIGGQSFVRVDVPASETQKAFTKFFGAGAIYAMTPCDEATCQAAVEGLRTRPIETYKLNLPQLRAPDPDEETEKYIQQREHEWEEKELERSRFEQDMSEQFESDFLDDEEPF